MPVIYVGDTAPVDFQLKWSDGTVQAITSAKCWAVINSAKTPALSPPLAIRQNVAAGAGGSDTDVPITDAANGKFSAYFPPADTTLLQDGQEYLVAGIVQLTDGRIYTAGVQTFTASGRPPTA
jgi:hypothetical protein